MRIALVLALIALSSLAWGESTPTVVLRPLAQPATNTTALARTLGETWAHLWTNAGFALVDGSEAHPARFEAQGLIVTEKGDLVLQLSVTDLQAHTVVASDMLSVFEGLTAFEPINGSLASVTKKVAAYWARVKDDPPPVAPLQEPLVFTSPDEGVEVFWQGHLAVGVVADGQVQAPYYAFPSNGVLTLTLEKKGWRTKTIDVALDPGTLTYPLPKLEKLRTEEWHLFDQAGRLLGLGTEYRQYVVPDWAFWSVEAYPFVQWRPDVSTSRAVLHLDTEASVGTWLYFDANSWFRLGWQASLGLLQTYTVGAAQPRWYLDGTVTPFGLVFEWNVAGVLVENRLQIPYSVGLPSGVLGPGWLLVGSTYPMLSLGVVTRW